MSFTSNSPGRIITQEAKPKESAHSQTSLSSFLITPLPKSAASGPDQRLDADRQFLFEYTRARCPSGSKDNLK